MGTQAPVIESTKEYAIFKLMNGNRGIDYNHVKELKRSMEAEPDLFASNPISVNEHMYIIDGQHRRQAAQELGFSIYYTVTPGLTLDDTRVLNSSQRRWTLLNFAESFAQSGRKDYIEFLRLVAKFPDIAPSIIRIYLAGGSRHQMSQDFKRGEFQIDDLQVATDYLGMLQQVITVSHLKINNPMAMAFFGMFKQPDVFDYDLFMQKLARESAQELLRPTPSIRGCNRSIEEVYNFQSKVQKRLY